MLLFIVKTPKSTSLAGNTPFEPSHVAVRRAVRPGRWAKSEKNIKMVAQNKRSLPNFACRFVSRMSFLVLSFRKTGIKMWELWRSKYPFSDWKGTSLIHQLVATAHWSRDATVKCRVKSYTHLLSTYNTITKAIYIISHELITCVCMVYLLIGFCALPTEGKVKIFKNTSGVRRTDKKTSSWIAAPCWWRPLWRRYQKQRHLFASAADTDNTEQALAFCRPRLAA